jgi:hypothetical protein
MNEEKATNNDVSTLRRWGPRIAGALAAVVVMGGIAAAVVVDPFGWLGPKVPEQCASREALDRTEGLGESALAEFVSACATAPLATEARLRLDRLIDMRETRVLLDAGYDASKINGYLTTCTRCTERDRAQERLADLAREERTYRDAAGDMSRLEGYVKQCHACQFAAPAQQAIDALKAAEGRPRRMAEERRVFETAGYDSTKLQAYIDLCTICALKQEAIDRLAKAATDRKEFEAAGDDAARLRHYVDKCVACTARPEAERKLGAIRAVDTQRKPEAPRHAAPTPSVQAPVGHRQPTAANTPPPTTSPTTYEAEQSKLDRELDRKVKSICRGC